MDEDDRKRIRGNYADIVAHLRVVDVQDVLFQEGILTDEDVEEISLDRGITPQAACRKLLRILPKRGNRAFSVFIASLQTNYPWLAEAIIKTDPRNVTGHSEDVVDTSDKLDILQSTLALQSKMMFEFQREIVTLKEKVTASEMEASKLAAKQDDFNVLVKEMGLSDSKDVVAYLRDVVQMQNQSVDFPDLEAPTCSLTDTVARTLGKDVVLYMSRKGQNVPVATNQYTITMRRLVMEVTSKHANLFSSIVDGLEQDIAGYQTLATIANEIFVEGDNNWGRIIVLYAFGGWVAKHFYENGKDELAETIGDFLGYYVSRKLGPWIDQKGGWDDLVNNFSAEKGEQNNETAKKILIAAAIGLGAAAIATIVGSRS